MPTITYTVSTLGEPALGGAAVIPPRPVDLALDPNGDLEVTTDARFTEGLESVTQGIRVRIQKFKGEWFLDLLRGLPWYQDILGQKFSEIKTLSAFRTEILLTPGTLEITRLTAAFDRSTRVLDVDWQALTEFGLTPVDSLAVQV